MDDRQAHLKTLLTGLHLGAFASTYAELALKAAKEGLSHEAFLYELARLEWERRTQRRIERLLHASELPREKTFRTLEVERFPGELRLHLERLRTGAFLEQAINVVAVGQPGVGKSHVLAAIGHELVTRGYSVFWSPASSIIQRLLAAKRDFRLPAELAKLHRVQCVILDDIGYVQHEQDEMEVLFTLLSDRYEEKSTLISTNLVFSQWNRIFKNPLTTGAAVDRVIHHSVILDMMGVSSYRAQQALTKERESVGVNSTNEHSFPSPSETP